GVDLPDDGKPAVVLRIEALCLLDEALDFAHFLFVPIRYPFGERRIRGTLLREGTVEARVFYFLVSLQLRLKPLPHPAPLGGRCGEHLSEGRLGLLMLLLQELDRIQV